MLEIKKEFGEYDAFCIKDPKNSKYVRVSKAFKSDGKTRKFMTLYMESLAKTSRNGKKKIGDQLGTIVKNVWEDRHRVLFDAIVAEIKDGNINESNGELQDLAISGNAYIAETRPYRTNINGVERIASRVRFFVFEGESPLQVYESTTAGLDFIKGDDDVRDEDIKHATGDDEKSSDKTDDDI